MPKDSKKKILVAEDEQAYSRALVLKLQNSGFEVESVENGEGALKVLETSHFDLLLSDLIMPKMDGFELLQKLKEKGIDLKIIVISNLSQTEIEKKVKDLGAMDFICKSDVSIADVVSKIKDLVDYQ